MKHEDVEIALLEVTSEVGPILGCGLVFGSEDGAEQFAEVMVDYFEAGHFDERSFRFDISSHDDRCEVELDVIAGQKHAWISLNDAPQGLAAAVRAALAVQPYLFLVTCTRGDPEPYRVLSEKVVAYRSSVNLDGEHLQGKQGGIWPAGGMVDLTRVAWILS